MRRLLQLLVCLCLLVVGACESFEALPTLAPTRALTGPTLESSPVVRGELPTEAPAQIIGQNDPTAAAAPSGGDLPPMAVGTPGDIKQAIQITAGDGALLSGDLYSGGTERVPGLLMLAPDSSAWLDLPLRLQAAGFTVLVMQPRDTTNQGDFAVMLRSLSDSGTVDPARIGVIGAEASADMALLGCASDMLCDVAALISPTQHDPLLVAMQRYNPRAIFLAAGDSDVNGIGAARAIEDFAQGEAVLEIVSGAQRGAMLVQENPTVGDHLIEWLRGQF